MVYGAANEAKKSARFDYSLREKMIRALTAPITPPVFVTVVKTLLMKSFGASDQAVFETFEFYYLGELDEEQRVAA